MTDGTTIWSTEHGLRALPEQLKGFGLMHVAMRRDAARLTAVAQRGAAGSSRRSRSGSGGCAR